MIPHVFGYNYTRVTCQLIPCETTMDVVMMVTHKGYLWKTWHRDATCACVITCPHQDWGGGAHLWMNLTMLPRTVRCKLRKSLSTSGVVFCNWTVGRRKGKPATTERIVIALPSLYLWISHNLHTRRAKVIGPPLGSVLSSENVLSKHMASSCRWGRLSMFIQKNTYVGWQIWYKFWTVLKDFDCSQNPAHW